MHGASADFRRIAQQSRDRHCHVLARMAALAALFALAPAVVSAQSAIQPQPVNPNAVAPAKPKAAAATKPAKSDGAATAPAAGDAGLKSRIENLEEQLVDLQVVVGTLDSFAKSSGAASASPAYRAGGSEAASGGNGGGVDSARLAGLEGQMRALTAQVQQLTEQLKALQAGKRADAGAAAASPAAAAGFSQAAAAAAASPIKPAASAGGGFGTTNVSPASPNSIDDFLSSSEGQGGAAHSGGATQQAALPADGANPKQLYETAYGYLLQQDYGAAEAAFEDFLKRFPNDGLAGNAQFWLGESFFVRGQFKPAATAFLKGYQTYARSSKAPDSLLKLAMSLSRMGQKDAACSSFGELAVKFPNASADVKARASAEKQRAGCPA